MPSWTTLLKILLPIVTLIGVYIAGCADGAANVQKKWDAQTIQHDLQIANLRGEIREKEKEHSRETNDIRQELADAETVLSDLRGDLIRVDDERMRLSRERADRYRSQADAGPDQCRSLASHAAGLDTSLEEGRTLVEELRGTLELRESQLRLLGRQIDADRALLLDD